MNEVQSTDSNAAIKSVTFFFAYILVCGNIVGSGIFITISVTFNVFDSSSIGMVIILWNIAGLISLIGGLCYVELGIRIPESGGERAYYSQIFNEKMAKLFVIFYVFVIRTLIIAGLNITAGAYLASLIPLESSKSYVTKILALACLLSCSIINCMSKKIVVRMSTLFTVLKMLALLIIIGGGIYYLKIGGAPEWKRPFTFQNFTVEKLGNCFINLFWTYEGWNTLGLVAGDMVNPSRDLLMAIIFGMVTVIVLYTLTIISYSAILGYKVVQSTDILGVLVGKILLGKAYPIIVVLIASSAIGAANGMMYTIVTAAESAGINGDLPKIFALVHKKSRTPIFSIFVITIICSVCLLLEFKTILNYCAFLAWIFYFISFCCLWKIKIETRNQPYKRIFKIPYPFIVLMQLVCVFIVGVSFYQEWKGCIVVSIIFILVYFLMYLPERYTQSKMLTGIQSKIITFMEKRLGLEVATIKDIK